MSDWPGPAWKGDPRRFYFAGEDLPSDARLAGLVAMFFACYGAGSPQHNEFAIAGKGDKGRLRLGRFWPSCRGACWRIRKGARWP